jgi:predicted extracellular nuclease
MGRQREIDNRAIWEKLMGTLRVLTASAVLLLTGDAVHAQIRITEWMYNGATPTTAIGEFVELTNIGGTSIDMTGWSFDDDTRTPGSQPLGSFGVVASHESVLLTDMTATQFRSAWGLSASVKVIGNNSNNLSRNDEINIYDASNALVDRLTYGDQNFPGTIRTQFVSGDPKTLAALGANDPSQWKLSVNGDSYGSHVATTGDLGNPGVFTLLPVPEPSTIGMMLMGIAAMGFCARRRVRRR